ncbi:MAG TPA: TRL domain-containing protein [Bacteroidia bacterium]|nr:TRL domain-containing protein [Bacteroidia bacterium]
MKKISIQSFKSPTKAFRLACASTVLLFLSSCSVMLPVSATSNPVGGSKTGIATATNVFGFWVSPDASIKTAAANAGITKISTVDSKQSNFLWIIKTYQTTVTGD